MMAPVAILAGGLATRLRPVTLNTPKSMLIVAGKPFIYHQLALLKSRGVEDVVLCLGNHGKLVEEYVSDGSAWGLNVKYSYDGATLLGTGGALMKALPLLPDEFFVLYGDSYLDIEMRPVLERFRSEGKPLLMTVYRNRGEADVSNILFKDGRIIRYDKKDPPADMEYIDYGLSVMKKSAFDGWPDDAPSDLADLYVKLVEKGEAAGFEVSMRFYEIGSFQGIKETEKYIKSMMGQN